METPTESSNQKKDPFEHLSKEELIKKCKQFLGIAQKAKQAKDEIVEENKGLTQKIQDQDLKSQKDVKAMQEMLNVLTHQKLQLVTDCDSLRTQNNKLKSHEQELIESKVKFETLDIANQSYGRQVKRLTDENEQLLNHLESLEQQINKLNCIGEQQRDQLLSIEQQNTTDEPHKNALHENELTEKLNESFVLIKQLENDLKNNELILFEKNQTLAHLYEEVDDLKAKNNQINELKHYCQSKKDEVDSLNKKLEESDPNSSIIKDLNKQLENTKTLLFETENKCKVLTVELETTKQAKEQYNEKLKSYHSKLIKVFSDLKDLKQNKNKLLSIIDDYSKYVHRWQQDMCKISAYFQTELNKRDIELKNYETQNMELHQQCDDLKEKLETYKENRIQINEEVLRKESESFNKELKQYKSNIDKLKNKNNELNQKCNDLKERNLIHEKNAEHSKKLITEMNSLSNELKIKDATITSLSEEKKQEYSYLTTINEQLTVNNKELTEQLEILTKENTNLQDKLTNLEQNENIRLDLNKKIKSNEETITALSEDNSKLLQNISTSKTNINEIHQLQAAKENLIQENTKLISNLEINEREKEELNQKITQISILIANLKEENMKLAETINNNNSERESLIEKYSNEILVLENDLKIRKETHSQSEPEIASSKTDEIQQLITEKEEMKMNEDSLSSLRIEKEELQQNLNQTKHVVEALKEDRFKFEQQINSKINNLEEENVKLANINADFESLKEKYKIETDALIVENKELFDIVACNRFKTQLLDYYTTITKYIEIEDSDIGQDIQAKVDTLKSNLEMKNRLIETSNIENVALRQSLKTIKDNLELENIDLIKFLQEAYKKIIDNLRQQLKNNSSQGKDKDNLLKDKSNNIESLNEENEMLQNELTTYKRDITDLQNQLSISKRENADLLKEMNDMNQALKERGETISKLQEYVQELIRKVKTLETEAAASKDENDKLEQELKIWNAKKQVVPIKITDNTALLGEKDDIIKTLEQEIQSLKESLNNSMSRENPDVADSETMSTSTVSRLDDASRFRDLEGTWEERYTKLRALAVKLKGKVKELTEQLTQERSEKTDIQAKLTTVTKNLQSVQTEFDKYQDQYELINKENKTTTKQIESIITENNKLKQDLKIRSEIVSKLKDEIESQRKEKTDLNASIKLLNNQINNLKKDIDNGFSSKKEFENKIYKLEVNIKTKEDELQKELKLHKATKELLQKLEKEVKKKSVLSLEMEDYERSSKDMSQKLEKKNEKINKLEMKVISQNNNIVSMKEQIRILEEKVNEAESHYQELEAQLLEVKSKLSEADAAVLQKESRIKEFVKNLESLKTINENISSELAQTVAHNQNQIEQLKIDKDHLKSQVLGLEEKMRDVSKKLNDREQELSLVQTEFSSYKVRAQSVLRQNQTRDVAHEEKLTDEVSELKSEVEAVTTKLNGVQTQFQLVTSKYETLEREKSQIQSQYRDLDKMLSKEKDDNRILIERQQQLVTEHRETMRAQKIHVDTLAQCYKQQLAEQEERHSKTITELQAAQISNTKSKTYDDHIDITSMRREDAEGSESVESNSNNLSSKMMPLSLDKLLKMDADSFTSHNFEAELSQCKKQIIEHQAQVKHLTELLADAEQDLAKHAQLNTLLKEEIRRHQRSIEREKHVENLEYLKNVIFKFITLASGDEKSHMVPVLNTILKLSPEETHKLNAVAKGDASTRGWGSYLPIWNLPNSK